MTPSPQIIPLIQLDVPFRPVAYRKDGAYHIGYEHKGAQQGQTITQAQAEALLMDDLNQVAEQLSEPFRQVPPIRTASLDTDMMRQFPQMIPTCNPQSMFDAVVALAFHITPRALLRSTLWKALLDAADEDTIRAEFERWVFEDGKPHPQHVARRQREANHFFSTP